MAYIGKTPTVGNFVKLDALTASATASYTMQVDSVNFSPESVNHMLVSLNGVIQAPTTSYTISGATITFASALTSSDSIDFIMVYGNVLDIGTPSDNTISQAKLVNESVNESKLQVSNSPTNGYFLSAQSGNTGGLTWAESGGGDLVKLGTVATNNSNVSALTIDNCFSSTYDLYRIVGYHSITSGGAHQYFRWRTGGASGSSYTTSDYQWLNNGRLIKSDPNTAEYANWNYTADHARLASDMRSDSNSAYVIFDLLVSDPNTNVMSRAFVTGTSAVRQNTDQRFVAHHVGITNGANVNATGFQMAVSTGSINYGRVSVYGYKQA